MKRFEYKFMSTSKYQLSNVGMNENPFGTLGDKGWELVTSVDLDEHYVKLMFKRELETQSASTTITPEEFAEMDKEQMDHFTAGFRQSQESHDAH